VSGGNRGYLIRPQTDEMEGAGLNATASLPDEPRRIVETIREEIERSRGQYIWQDYIRALRVISEAVFTKSAGFILEFVQNAEDAGAGLGVPGEVRICIGKERIKIIHNGRPFTEENVRALCSIRSSKKPEQGTLGYLGIGFKSVFKITDAPEIYSGGFSFKFDRGAHAEPQETPWQVLPIWLSGPSEKIDQRLTTFILPLREQSDYKTVERELGQLRIGLYLFLRWIKRIVVEDEIRRETWKLESLEDGQEDVKTLRRGHTAQRFRFFRRTCLVPEWLKSDRLVHEFRRDNVLQREVVIAFAMDEAGNLDSKLAGTMYGGVYSFLPLAEATSGATFAIQTDFLVQPGREAINHEAKWNHWLVEQVTILAKETIEFFKSDPKWKYQFLRAFEFKKAEGDEGYERFFYPKLIKPLEDFIANGNCVLTIDGHWANFSQVLRLDETPASAEDWVTMGIFNKQDIAPMLGGRPGLHFVDPQVAERPSTPFKRVDRHNLLDNSPLLKSKAERPDAADWFRSLYRWLQKHSRNQPYSNRTEQYHGIEFVLTEDCRLMRGGDVWLPDLDAPHAFLEEFAELLRETRAILHPGILEELSSEERDKLRGFLLGYLGVQRLDSKQVCRQAVLPRLMTTSDKPGAEELLKLTRICHQVLGGDIGAASSIWVLDKHGVVRPAKEVIFSNEFAPPANWETHQLYVPTWNFLSSEYLPPGASGSDVVSWRDFFKAGGVKEELEDGVELFAVNFAKQKLSPSYDLGTVETHNLGYDLVGTNRQTKQDVYIEVKGRKNEVDIELTGNETEAANHWRESYCLCVVANIPWAPAIYLLPNPAKHGRHEKLTIPTGKWKSFPVGSSS
jgi:hypothetical protein